MTYILATARSHFEFVTADAINNAGGFAVVPRKVDITKDAKTGKWVTTYRPFLPNFLFIAATEEAWYAYQHKRLFHEGAILPLMRRQLDILPRTWGDFQGFAERAERACDLRLEQHEAGQRVATYRKGDRIRIMGNDLLNGQLRDKLARFVGIGKDGRIEAEVEGMEIMGKPVTVRLGPGDVRMAAE